MFTKIVFSSLPLLDFTNTLLNNSKTTLDGLKNITTPN